MEKLPERIECGPPATVVVNNCLSCCCSSILTADRPHRFHLLAVADAASSRPGIVDAVERRRRRRVVDWKNSCTQIAYSHCQDNYTDHCQLLASSKDSEPNVADSTEKLIIIITKCFAPECRQRSGAEATLKDRYCVIINVIIITAKAKIRKGIRTEGSTGLSPLVCRVVVNFRRSCCATRRIKLAASTPRCSARARTRLAGSV